MMDVLTVQSSRIVRAVAAAGNDGRVPGSISGCRRGSLLHHLPVSAWGSRQDRPFCSGDGSIREDAIAPYCDMVRGFVESNGIKRVVDLGCGDFGVGSRIICPNVVYTGIDVVPDLIDYNQKTFGSPGVEFRCLNIIDDDLPSGDLCLVRQVLQHLSNAQIQRTLKSLTRYRHVIVTEHVYSGLGVRRNLDKPQGPGTRIPKRSGVFLESPPFSCAAKVMLEVPLAENDLLRSVALSSFAAAGSN